MPAHLSRSEEVSPITRWLTHPWVNTLFAGIALSLIVVFNAFFYIYRPYDGLEAYSEDPLGEVYTVYPGGPAEEAGVQIGDHILAISGREINPLRNEPRYPAGLQSGESIIYRIQRDEAILEIPLTIGNYSKNLPLLSTYLSLQILAFLFWGIGLVLLRYSPHNHLAAKLLGTGFMLAGVNVAVGSASGWNSFWYANTIQKVLYCLLGALLISAHLSFPAPTMRKYRPAILSIGWLVAAGLATLVLLEDLILVPRSSSLAVVHGIYPRQIVLVFFLTAWLLSVALLIYNRFLSSDMDIRRQTGIIIWGMLLSSGPFITFTLLPYILFGEEYLTGSVTILFLGLLPLAYAYVIFQRKLLHIDLLINRVLVSFLLVLLIITTSILAFGVVVILFDLPARLPLYGGVISALIVLPFPRLQEHIQALMNRILYGSHYEYTSITYELSNRLTQALDRDTLAEILTVRLPRQMGILEADLLLDRGAGALEEINGGSKTQDYNSIQPVFRWLESAGKPIRLYQLEEIAKLDGEALPDSVHWVQVYVPMIFENRLQGVILYGKRAAGDVYSEQDLRILAAVAHQAALAWENIRLVKRFRDLTRELVRSDEVQRKRLAGDLHDSILQDLFYIKQSLYQQHKDSPLAEQVGVSINRLRRVIKAQRPAMLNQGLSLALQDLVAGAGHLVGEKPEIRLYNGLSGEPMLSEEQSTIIYRIAQEAMTNAIKHAASTRIEIRLERSGAFGLRLQVWDDGIGIPAWHLQAGLRPGHYGLAIMRERAAMIRASLAVQSHPGGGTQVILELSDEA